MTTTIASDGMIVTVSGDSLTVSDGFHTVEELYDHRIALWIAVCRLIRNEPRYEYRRVWRTDLHSDGSSFTGWFVLGITLEDNRQITYHLPLSRWNECEFAETLWQAPEFDGHTSADVIERIGRL